MAVKIIHKNSSVEFKNALGDQLEFGELALNYHESGPYLQCKDADGEVINLGGVYITEDENADAPGTPLPGRLWLRADTLFIWDGDNWVQIGGGDGDQSGSGGGATITVIGGDGIEASTIGTTVTVTADINESRGLEFVGDQIAVKLGAGLGFDTNGKIEATIKGGLSYKGTVDVTGPDLVTGASEGDLYANTGTGKFSAQWAAVTANATTATDAKPGDWVIYEGPEWDHISITVIGTDLGIANRDATDLEVTSSTGADATIPAATQTLAGLMTAQDKVKLDGQLEPDEIVTSDDINDGKLTIKDSDGNDLGEFTANQEGPTDITLPDPPEVNDGILTIKQGTTELGTFSANQADAEDIVIPDPPVPPIQSGEQFPANPNHGDIFIDTSECPPILYLWNDSAECSTGTGWEIIQNDFDGDYNSLINRPIDIDNSAPGGAVHGQLWIDTDECPPVLNVYIDSTKCPGEPSGWQELITPEDIQTANDVIEGIVRLSDSVTSTSDVNDGIAATPKAVKTAYDRYPITGSDVTEGIVRLSDSVTSTSGVNDGIAATPKAVKEAYDKALEAAGSGGGIDQPTADGRYVRVDNVNQNVAGTKSFTNKLEVGSSAEFQLQKDGSPSNPCVKFPNDLNLFSRRANTGSSSTSSQDLVIHRQSNDANGMYISFIDGDNSSNYGNVKVGLRRNNPNYALDVAGSCQMSQLFLRQISEANDNNKGLVLAATSGGGGTIRTGAGASAPVSIQDFKINNSCVANGNQTYIDLKDASRSPFMTFKDDINFRQYQSSDGGQTLYGFGMAKGTGWTGSGVVYAGWIGNGNCKWGFRTHRPEAAVHVAASMKANQYQNTRTSEFDGAFFSSPVEGINFQDRVIAEEDLVLNKAVYTKAPEVPSVATVSTAETAAAKAIKAALTKYTDEDKVRFGIDTQSLEAIFEAESLEIDDYGIVKTLELEAITQEQNRLDDGSLDEEEPDRIYRAEAVTYKSIDYQALFAFVISAMPDFDAQEARITALEGRAGALEAGEVSDDATDAALLTLVSDMAARITALENP